MSRPMIDVISKYEFIIVIIIIIDDSFPIVFSLSLDILVNLILDFYAIYN